MNHREGWKRKRGYDPQILTQQGGEPMSKIITWQKFQMLIEARNNGANLAPVDFENIDSFVAAKIVNVKGNPAPPGLPVRIAVCVNPKTKEWHSSGWTFEGKKVDDEYLRQCASFGDDKVLFYWVEAVIPIPDPPVIVGTVTEGE